MIEGVRLKVCGLTSLIDAEGADRVGADYLGFILYPPSPRHVTLAQYEAMARRLPDRKKVAVMVAPTPAELERARQAGFDYFQIHFPADTPEPTVAGWAGVVGAGRLWLAPKLPPGHDVSPAWLPHATAFLMDTFHAAGFGGSGLTGDWDKFARHRVAYPQHTWILAGGLNATNIGAALTGSGARYVDVNSGVEAAPGVKDENLLRAFVVALQQAVARPRT